MKIFQVIDWLTKLFNLNKKSKVVALLLMPTFTIGQSAAAFWLAGGEQQQQTLPIVTNGLIAYYDASNVNSYDPANPGSTWNDLSGNNYHVTNYGATHSTDYGGVFYFDGVDDYMVYEGAINEDVMTFSIWTKGSSITDNCIVDLDDINLTNDLQQELYIYDKGSADYDFKIVSESSGGNELNNTNTVINPNVWYNVTYTYNGSIYAIYINNTLVSLSTDTGPTIVNGDFFFNGYIGELFFYDRVLTSQELTDNYNATKDRYINYLLDEYPGAAAAYSVRALNSNYTGPLMTIRRSSDNAEEDIFALANGDLDEDLINYFCSGTTCYVRTWYDQSGNGYNLTQSGSPAYVYTSNQIIKSGAKPAIQLAINNANQAINLVNTNLVLTQPYTILTVAEKTLNADRQALLSSNNYSGSNAANFGSTIDVLNEINIYGGVFLFGSDNFTTGRFAMAGLYNGSNSSTKFNNNNIITGNAGVNNLSGLLIGGVSVANNYAFIGKITEIIIYNNNYSSNYNQIFSNFNSYYSIY